MDGELHSAVALADPPGILPKACKAGFIDIEWAIKDFTKSEVQQSWRNVVLHPLKVPLQAFGKLPAAMRRLPSKAAWCPRRIRFRIFFAMGRFTLPDRIKKETVMVRP